MNRVTNLLTDHGILITLVLWAITPVYYAITSTGPWGSFLASFLEPSAFVPGLVGLVLTILVTTVASYKTLQERIEHLSTSLTDEVGQIKATMQNTARAADEAEQLQKVYGQLMQHGSNKHTAPIAEFAKNIFGKAQEDLHNLQYKSSYTLDVREKTDSYTTEWIKTFRQVVKSSDTHGRFMTVSNMVIWSDTNLGFTEKGWSKYHEEQIKSSVADRFVVQRIFVVPPMHVLETNKEQAASYLRTLTQYQALINEAVARERAVAVVTSPASEPQQLTFPRYENRVFVTTDRKEYDEHFQSPANEQEFAGSGNFALWALGEDRPIVANTVTYYHRQTRGMEPGDYPIQSFSFTWDRDIITKKYNEFKDKWSGGKAKDLEWYIKELHAIVAVAKKPEPNGVADVESPLVASVNDILKPMSPPPGAKPLTSPSTSSDVQPEPKDGVST
ncbi:MAG: hypothetical protein ABL982_10800 [Vicinamibacterales bacterium]